MKKKEEFMDYRMMTAPCGRDCFNCPLHLAIENEGVRQHFVKNYQMDESKTGCTGCRSIEGKCYFLQKLGFSSQCKIYRCAKGKGAEFCYECGDFPCELLQPLADGADKFPHNLKVYNLCLIQKMGVENWGKNMAKKAFDNYYKKKLDL
jgi:hypothetical protein